MNVLLRETEVPFKSDAQRKLMYAVANNPDVAKKTGISKKVADKFIQHKAEGGSMATKMPKEGSAEYKAQERRHVNAMKKAGVDPKIVAEEKREAGLKKGGCVKRMADGGIVPVRKPAVAPAASAARMGRPKYPDAEVSPAMQARMQKMLDEQKASRENEREYNRASTIPSRPGMKNGGAVKKYAKGGGIEAKGKTRGKVC